MKYKNGLKQLRLFSFLSLMFFLNACKKPEAGVGQNLLPPGDELFANSHDSTEIYTSTISHPTGKIRTDIYTSCMIGNYVDPVFGKVKSSSYLEFDLSSDFTVFPENVEVTRVVLNLEYLGRHYGFHNQAGFVVNRLTTPFAYDSAYYTNSSLSYLGENLIVTGFQNVTTQSELAPVSTSAELKSLSLPLKKELGEFLLGADSAQSSTLANFRSYFSGLRIASSTPDAQVINYDLVDVDSKLSVYYDVIEPDTTYSRRYDFILSDSCKHFTRIDRVAFGTPIENVDSYGELDGTLLCYPQSSGSTALKVNMDELDWVRDDPQTLINQAWLVMPFDSTESLSHINYFTLHYYDDDDELQVVLKDGAVLISQLRTSEGYYYVDLTNFVQEYANGEHEITELILLPQVGTLNTERVIIHGTGYNVADRTQNTRLLITFTN